MPTRAMRSIELSIGGMTCAACAARLERKLNRLDGVHASVNYATEKASVEAPAGVAIDELVAQVEHGGYRAAQIASEVPGAQDDPVRYLLRRLVVALLLGVPLGDDLAGGDVVCVAIPPRRCGQRPAPLDVDGHPGVLGVTAAP